MHHDRTDRRIGQAGVLLGILATSLPAAFADDTRTEAPGTWFITRASSVELRSAGPDIAQYPVLRLGRGELLRIEAPEMDGDWAKVHLLGPSVADVRGLMPLGTSSLVDGDIAVVQASTPIFAPNLRAIGPDGHFSTTRAWRCLLRVAPGTRVLVTDRFEVDGETWALVAPPDGVVLWVDPSDIRPATAEEIPALTELLSVEDVVERQLAARLAAMEALKLASNTTAVDDDATGDPVLQEAPGGGFALARPLEPVPDEFGVAEIEGDWYVLTKAEAQAFARPYGTSGGYAVLNLPPNSAVFVTDFEDLSAKITPQGGASGLRGLLELDDAVELDGDTARILQPTDLRSPNLKFTEDDGRPNPMRSYQSMLELEGGELLTVVDRFESRGRTWLLVEPPIEASVFVRTSEIRPATAEEVAAALDPEGVAEIVEPEAIEPEVAEPEVVEPEVVEPEVVEPEVVEPEVVEPEVVEPDREIAPPPAEELREARAKIAFPDGVPGIWKQLRANGKSILTGPDGQANYAFARLDDGDLVCVVDESPTSGWCQLRLVGPSLEDVRGLVKAQEGMIDVDGDVATVVRGEHEVRAPNLIGRGLDGDGQADPMRSYLPFSKVRTGDTFVITGSLVDRGGATWFEVVPPLESVGWIHRGYLEQVAAEDLPFEAGVDAAGRPRFTGEDDIRPVEPEIVEVEEVGLDDVEMVDETEVDDDNDVEMVDETEVDDDNDVEMIDETEVDDDDDVEMVDETEVDDDDVEMVDETEVDDDDDVEMVDETDVDDDNDDVEMVNETEVDDDDDVEMIDETEVDDDVDMVEEPEVDLIEEDSEPVEPEITLEPEPETEPEPEPEPAPVLSPEILQSVTLEEAESTYNEIRASPENDAEFEALELIYQTISERPSTSSTERSRAEIRLKQIRIQRDLQRRIDTLRRLENRANVDRERIEAIRQALLDRADYTAIGRLARSRVYDGRTLPLLYRLEEPGSGRTIAYVRPDDALSIQSGVGRIVGIVGTERDDPGYRIRIITPERFEIDLTEEIAEN